MPPPTTSQPFDRGLRLRVQTVGLVALALALLLFQVLAEKHHADRMIGMTMGGASRDGGLLVTGVEAGGPAARAGMRAGDRILGAAGVVVQGADSYRDAMARFRGKAVPFVVARGDRRLTLPVTPGVPMPWGDFLLNTLVGLSYLVLALLALRQRDLDLRARLLFWFALAVTIEFLLPISSSIGPLHAFVTQPLRYLITGLQMGLELHLASVIPARQPWLERHRWVIPTYYVVGLALGGLDAFTYFVEHGLGSALPWSADQADTLVFNYGFVIWALAETALLARPALTWPEPQGRHQAALVLAGSLPWAASSAIDFGHFLAGQEPPAWVGAIEPFVLLCFPIAVLIAISRYQLLDLEMVVRRSLVYTALTTTLLLVFYAALGAGGVLFSEFMTGGDRVWVVAGATLLLGLLFTPLRRALESGIYRRFFPERLAMRERLTALAADLPSLGKLPLMGEKLVDDLGEILGVRWATLLIADPRTGLLMPLATTAGESRPGAIDTPVDGEHGVAESLLLSPEDPGLRLLTQSGRSFQSRQLAVKSAALALRLQAMGVQVASPLLSHGKLIGLLLLGAKKAGERYLAEEMDLLNLLAQHVAIVFENARLFESATRDSLTGLLRREAVLERLDAELQRAQRYGRPLSIGLADLDHFKSVNDRFGHLTGDAMLKWVSRVLHKGLRSTDHLGRYGGEEFLLVLPETDLQGAAVVAEKVRALVEQERFTTEDGHSVGVTLSIGLAALADRREHTTCAKDLIAAADRSLYRAKEEGRNQVHPSVAVGA